MSHFSEIKTELKDSECLIKALQDLGFTPEICEQPRNLTGYMGDIRPQVADIIVSRRQIDSAANDLGFRFNQETQSYETLISEYDQRWGVCAPGKGLGPTFVKRLMNEYNRNVVVKTAESLGQPYEITQTETGYSITVKARSSQIQRAGSSAATVKRVSNRVGGR